MTAHNSIVAAPVCDIAFSSISGTPCCHSPLPIITSGNPMSSNVWSYFCSGFSEKEIRVHRTSKEVSEPPENLHC